MRLTKFRCRSSGSRLKWLISPSYPFYQIAGKFSSHGFVDEVLKFTFMVHAVGEIVASAMTVVTVIKLFRLMTEATRIYRVRGFQAFQIAVHTLCPPTFAHMLAALFSSCAGGRGAGKGAPLAFLVQQWFASVIASAMSGSKWTTLVQFIASSCGIGLTGSAALSLAAGDPIPMRWEAVKLA